ncbi:MAG: hypothetical protein ACREMB_25835 [Candidatus Rokuibacteriota bacterium]
MRAGAVLGFALAAGLALGVSAAAPPAGGALLPVEEHDSPDARLLAETHAEELVRLHADVLRCHPGMAIHRHGIGFRKPRRGPNPAPALTLWVWLDPAQPPRGADLAARAGDAFRRQGAALFRRLIGRSPVFADPRVDGYGVVLTWLSPVQRGRRLVGESLAVFADKLAAANFVHETISSAVFLSRAQVRAFDGETELERPQLRLSDDEAPAGDWSC